MSTDQEWITVRQLAERVGRSPATLYHELVLGMRHARRGRGRIFCRVADYEAWIESHLVAGAKPEVA